MLELENPLDDFIRLCRALNLHRSILRNHRLLFRKITQALEKQVSTTGSNLHLFTITEPIHITTDLLEIRGRHVDDARETETGNCDILNIRVKDLQEVIGRGRLVRVFHLDPKFVGILRGQIKGERIIVPHRLDELEQVNHINAEHMLLRAIILIETIRMETQVDQYSVRLIHRHNLDSRRIKFQVRLCKNFLQSLYKSSEGSRLDCFNLKEIAIRVRKTHRHTLELLSVFRQNVADRIHAKGS